MSNYNKSYNFTNGLQVDDSNFVVTANGLVGIGTTVPQKTLDVRGNTQINGGLTATNLNVTGIVTVGAGITLDATSGIITATKFVGDASGLTNIVAISTVGLIANAGSLSTTAKLGIGNLTPTKQLDVIGDSEFNGDVNVSGILTTGQGVRITSGGINAVGVVTATSLVIDDYIYHAGNTNTFIGFESDNTIRFNTNGSDKLKINASGHLILLDDQDTYIYRPSDNTISVVTGGSERFSVSGAGVTVTGEVSATGAIRGTSFSGHSGVPAEFSNGLIATASTFTGDVTIGSGATVGIGTSVFFAKNRKAIFNNNLEIFAGDDDSIIRHTASNAGQDMSIESDTAIYVGKSGLVERFAYFQSDSGVILYNNNEEKIQTIGSGASVYGQLNVASFNGGTSGLSSHFGSLRYGNESGSAPYSTRRSLDLINTDSGNINFYIDAENRGNTGNFHWHKGFNNATLMTLTGVGGSLGIGVLNPSVTLDVEGGAAISGNVSIGNNLDVTNNLTINGSLFSNVTGNVIGDLTGNISSPGVSTFKHLDVTGISTVFSLKISGDGLSVGTDLALNDSLTLNSGINNRVFVTSTGEIGVKTSLSLTDVSINASQANASIAAVAVGATILKSAVDFADAGTPTTRFMLPPKVSSTAGLQNVVAGAMVYNTSSNRLELYNGSAWVGISTEV